MLLSTCAALTLGVMLTYGRGVLPGVSAAGVAVGGLSRAEAAQTISAHWQAITLRDEDRTWQVAPARLGLTIDANATARAAFDQGRGDGSIIDAIIGEVDVAPVLELDITTAAAALVDLAPQFNIPAQNAGVRLVNGVVEATPPSEGRELDAAALVTRLDNDVQAELADGVIDLPMRRVPPTLTDSSQMVALARDLLANPLLIEAYDPIRDESLRWSVPPEAWSNWLTAEPDPASSIGLALTVQDAAVRDFLNSQSAALGADRYIELDAAVQAVQDHVRQRQTDPFLRIYHQDRQHVVQPGESIIAIGWDYGVPYPWIQAANPGVGDNLSIGQTITIPSADNFLEFPVVRGKRIVVSMAEQRVRVYENGALKWDWAASTGITDSPTWPGIYQIISHVPNAYAARWNLYMPNFMGVYRPIPGQDFTNGFHGFPTRGGSQIIWTNSLGTRVTYGCILVSDTNSRLLYDWAEDGVVVEIQP